VVVSVKDGSFLYHPRTHLGASHAALAPLGLQLLHDLTLPAKESANQRQPIAESKRWQCISTGHRQIG